MYGGNSLQSINAQYRTGRMTTKKSNITERERANKRMEADERERAHDRQKMTPKEALELILANHKCPALNLCVSYAKYALKLNQECRLAELRVQLLYVVSNLDYWRVSKAFQVTAEQIKECRSVLKAACK